MRSFKKAGALLLTAVMAGTMLLSSACSKSDEKLGVNETVSADSPWYTLKTISISESISMDEYESLDFQYIGSTDKGYIFSTYGSKKMPANFEPQTEEDWLKYQVNDVMLVDKDGKVLQTVDVNSIVPDKKYRSGYGVFEKNGKFYVVLVDTQSPSYETYQMEIDPATLKGGKVTPYDDKPELQNTEDGVYFEGTWDVGEYTIAKYWIELGNENYSYRLIITGKDGKDKKIELKDELPGEVIYDISSFWDIGGGKIMAICGGMNDNLYLTIDTSNGSVEKLSDKETKWISEVNMYNLKMIDGKGPYFTDEEGLHKIDFSKKKVTDILDYDWCNLNRDLVYNLDPISVSDKEIIFGGVSYSRYGLMNKTDYKLYVLTKADKNPNAGKTILKVCFLDYSGSEVVYQALCDFNETNKDFFLKIDDRYSTDDVWANQEEELETSDDWMKASLKAQSKVTDQLAIDLMNGEGPDIIIGGFSCPQLNNEQYLLDLTEYTGDMGDKYFTNVIDAAKDGDAIYQLPVSFSLSGIVTQKQYVDSGKKGFTFDEYKKFVKDTCNGQDPMTQYSGKISFFITCMSAMSDLFFDDDGNIDLDNKAFKELAKYTKDNVNDPANFDSSSEAMMEDENYVIPADYTTISGFSSFLTDGSWYTENYDPNNKVILGIPSYDGRGPQILVNCSIAISAEAPNPDGCWAFVKTLISEENQIAFAESYSTPILVSAFEKNAKDVVKSYNEENGNGDNVSASMMDMGLSFKVDEKLIDNYKKMISGCKRANSFDTQIATIVVEEIPAYFEGQKSIDDVISIAEDRAQKIINERG
ncbi:MAG: extracellular solute-binding protein [Clostridiales bacterium]|nr:extracellular solute-binding protein [Clostridiales bacterium]